MGTRINILETEPQAYKAMAGLEAYINSTPLNKSHKELIKIRASQINGCAYCINMHTQDALKQGETVQRIFLLNAWKETDLFTEEEKAILALTEEVTLIHQHGVSNSAYEAAAQLFDKNYLAQLVMMMVAINGWNRIQVTCQVQPAS
ncbi:carboxymuconolactone decarboxylase family protein [Pedobacter psychroterrae]|uniref:Carboxymuconolactone decarboxylase family protein n=1 Tax=Pedobacter psychroterrae TaxID=2530453 RepID=A0A4R0NE33_9SPHI|nr:carboxymuconolactone decarboxylase family protein [Pedobacter psychroterrae]TCC97382.1 carboxymuconolactone decarboxylase family protein [Pedobacter psychroterrae]